jgi:hypothetical protein
VYYAARQNIYHIFDDFSQPPLLYRPAVPMPPVVVEAARIHNLLINNEGYRDVYLDLSRRFNDDAQAHFLAAFYSFVTHTLPDHAEQARTAFELAPQVGTYQLITGLAALQQKNCLEAIQLLESLQLNETERPLEPLRLYGLQLAWKDIDPEKMADYAHQLESMLEQYGAVQFFNAYWKPLVDPA